jgi:hypothetical protein
MVAVLAVLGTRMIMQNKSGACAGPQPEHFPVDVSVTPSRDEIKAAGTA